MTQYEMKWNFMKWNGTTILSEFIPQKGNPARVSVRNSREVRNKRIEFPSYPKTNFLLLFTLRQLLCFWSAIYNICIFRPSERRIDEQCGFLNISKIFKAIYGQSFKNEKLFGKSINMQNLLRSPGFGWYLLLFSSFSKT